MDPVINRATVIILNNDKIVLMHRKRHGEEFWVIPGGGIELNETNEEAAIREVKEETGLSIKNLTFLFKDSQKWGKGDNFIFLGESEYQPLEMSEYDLSKITPDNWYQPEWLDIVSIKDMSVHPESVKKYVIDNFSSI